MRYTLHINPLRAGNLYRRERWTKQDPYCTFTVGDKKCQTNVHEDGDTRAEWHQDAWTFDFDEREEMPDEIIFQVMNKNVVTDDTEIAGCALSLGDLDDQPHEDKWIELRRQNREVGGTLKLFVWLEHRPDPCEAALALGRQEKQQSPRSPQRPQHQPHQRPQRQYQQPRQPRVQQSVEYYEDNQGRVEYYDDQCREGMSAAAAGGIGVAAGIGLTLAGQYISDICGDEGDGGCGDVEYEEANSWDDVSNGDCGEGYGGGGDDYGGEDYGGDGGD